MAYVTEKEKSVDTTQSFSEIMGVTFFIFTGSGFYVAVEANYVMY